MGYCYINIAIKRLKKDIYLNTLEKRVLDTVKMVENDIQQRDALVPINEHKNLIAIVNSDIAHKIGINLERVEEDTWKSKVPAAAFGRCTRVSDMNMSRYGIMGYAEYSVVQECLGGIVLFPKKLALVLQFFGEDVWRQYKEKHFDDWNLDDHIEKLDDPRHIGVPFADEIYFWAVKPDYRGVGGQMIDQIRGVVEETQEYLKILDEGIDEVRGYIPQDPRDDFSRLQIRGFLPG